MDPDRAAGQALSAQAGAPRSRRPWPLLVRRARPEDREAVLSFATRTWDGWDYIPHAWPVWIDADDGVLLVGEPADAAAVDANADGLTPGRPIAIARVAMTASAEAWLEGIRVDPRVRGMDVATDLQVAELQWAAAMGASVVRYATGERNEGSHRLGARHGFELLCGFRTYFREPPDGSGETDEDDNGFDDEARRRATAARRALLGRLRVADMVAAEGEAADWWTRVSEDAMFRAGHNLYEHRAWSLQELTRSAFLGHVSLGEVLVARPAASDGGWAVAILPGEALPSEDVSLHLALLVGDWKAALGLAVRIQGMTDAAVRFRLPEIPEIVGGVHDDAFAAAGFARREWTLHILGRLLDRQTPPPETGSALVMADRPVI